MIEFKIGQRVQIDLIGEPFHGLFGSIVSRDNNLYKINLDQEVMYARKFSRSFFFYEGQFKIINMPGVCNKCASLTAKDRNICCSCLKNV